LGNISGVYKITSVTPKVNRFTLEISKKNSILKGQEPQTSAIFRRPTVIKSAKNRRPQKILNLFEIINSIIHEYIAEYLDE
jgi:hypothetical protein